MNQLELGPRVALVGCVFALAAVGGCRIGGGSGVTASWPADAQQGGATEGTNTGANAGSSAGGSGGDTHAQAGTSGAGSLPTTDAQTAPTSDSGFDPRDGDAGGQLAVPCRAPTVNVCDPVANSGCGVGMQCDVDLVPTTLSGRCAFSSPMDAGACFTSFATESCPPRTTCDNGACRTLCFCDTDCPKGECCHESLGTLGFKLCKPCP